MDLKNSYLQMTMREEDRSCLTNKLAKGYRHRLTRSSGSPNLRGTPNNLEQVLIRLNRYDLRGNVQKSEFLKDRIEFCRHVIDSKGLHKTTEKVSAVLNASVPKNVSELRTFLD